MRHVTNPYGKMTPCGGNLQITCTPNHIYSFIRHISEKLTKWSKYQKET